MEIYWEKLGKHTNTKSQYVNSWYQQVTIIVSHLLYNYDSANYLTITISELNELNRAPEVNKFSPSPLIFCTTCLILLPALLTFKYLILLPRTFTDFIYWLKPYYPIIRAWSQSQSSVICMYIFKRPVWYGDLCGAVMSENCHPVAWGVLTSPTETDSVWTIFSCAMATTLWPFISMILWPTRTPPRSAMPPRIRLQIWGCEKDTLYVMHSTWHLLAATHLKPQS